MRLRATRLATAAAAAIGLATGAVAGAGGGLAPQLPVTPEAMASGVDGPATPDVVRAERIGDRFPGGRVAVPPGLNSRGWVVDNPVVSNVDTTLAGQDRVDDGEPVIAVNPLHPNQIVLLTGRDGGEIWTPGGCSPNPSSCPMGAGNKFGSIWLSDDGGNTWAKHYDIPPPTGVPNSICVCDRVLSWADDGTLTLAVLVIEDSVYIGTTTDPFAGAWSWTLDSTGRAIPITHHDALPVRAGDVGAHGYIDQPWIVTAPDPADPSKQDVLVSYADDGSRGYDERYGVWVATAHGDNQPLVSDRTQIWKIPVCCDGRVEPSPYFPGPTVMTLRLAADRRTGTVWGLYGVPLGYVFGHPDPAAHEFSNLTRSGALVEQRLTRSTDGGRTWSLGGRVQGVAIDRAGSMEEAAKFGRFSGPYGGTHMVAVDHNDGSAYVVYADFDVVTGKNRLAIRHITADAAGNAVVGPKHYVNGQADAVLPAMDVADDGTVGILYDQLDGYDADGFAVVSVHLARSHDGGATFDDQVVNTFASVEQEDPNNVRQRPLGDYQQLVAVGDTFYGVSTTNGASFGRPVVDWDPVFVRAPSYDR